MSLQQQEEDKLVIQGACDVALRNDAAKVLQVFKCQQRNPNNHAGVAPLNAPLLKSTKQAQILHQKFFQNFSTTARGDANQQLLLMRSLLMVPPFYETPWSSAFSFVQSVHFLGCGSGQYSHSTLRSFVAEIQSFLQQTIAAWWERERRWNSAAATMASRTTPTTSQNSNATTSTKTPRDWILKLTKRLLVPLEEESSLRINNHWMVPLDLVSTIVSLMLGFEPSFHQDLLNCVFQFQSVIRPDRLLPWLSLATDLHPFLRPRDWDKLLSTLQQHNSESIDQGEDLPGLMAAVVLLSAKMLHCEEGGKLEQAQARETFQSWRRVASSLLYAASNDLGIFSTVMGVFEDCISSLPSDILQAWMWNGKEGAEDDDDVPDWVHANVVLTLMRVAQKSGSAILNRLLSRAITHSDRAERCDVAQEGWNEMVRLACGKGLVPKRQQQASKEEKWIRSLEAILEGATYTGKGLFQCNKQDSGTEILNRVGRLVYQSLFLLSGDRADNSPNKKSNPNYLAERAQDWINTVIDKMKAGISLSHEAVVIAVAFIIVFCEIPMSRTFVVTGMLQAIKGEADFIHSKADIALLTSLIISIVVKQRPSIFPEMKPIVDVVVAGKLPKRLFFPLVGAFAPTSLSAQEALFAVVQKRVHDEAGYLSFGVTATNENHDRIQCYLYALCVLITVPEWNATIMDAWKFLSSILVCNRPPLPLIARSWLFDLMAEFLESGRFSQEVSDRVFRACLVRLLSFMRQEEGSSKISMCPRTVLAVWTSARSAPTEDVLRLFKLLFSLFFAERNEMMPAIAQWRSVLFSRCGAGATTSPPPELDFDIKGDASDDNNQPSYLYCKLSVVLVISALDFALDCAGGPSHACQVNAIRGLDIDALKRLLLSQESRSCEAIVGVDRLGGHMGLPWLDQCVGSTDQDGAQGWLPPQGAQCVLAATICDSVALLIRDYRWSFTTANLQNQCPYSERKERLLALHALSSAKAVLSPSSGATPVGVSPFLSQGEILANGALMVDSAIVISHSVSTKADFADTDNVLSETMDHLDALNFLDADLEDHFSQMDQAPLLYGVWQLYTLAFDEEASIRLISYLEETREGQVSMKGESPKISNEVDSRVRGFRSDVLRLLFRSLQRVASDGTSVQLFTNIPALEECDNPEPRFRGRSFRWTKKPKADAPSFLKKCLETLADDLSSGIQGQSGGVSTEMYASYLDCIALISKLLTTYMRNRANTESFSIRESQTKLWSGLCCFPPKKKALFSKAFLVIGQALPTLDRCVTKESFHGMADAIDDDIEGTRRLPGSFGIESFELCTEVLKEWVGTDKASSLSWDGLKTPNTSDGNNMRFEEESKHDGSTEDSSLPASGGQQRGVPNIVTVSVECTPNKQDVSATGRPKLVLNTKEQWSWTCSCAIQCMEQVWIDVCESIRTHDKDSTQPIQCPLPDSTVGCTGRRLLELLAANKTLKLAFVEMVACDHERGGEPSANHEVEASTGKSSRWLVEVFPHESKIRLFSLIERIVTVTSESTKVLGLFLQGKSTPSPLRFLAALAITLVWLTTDHGDGFDCATDARKWFLAEKKRLELTRGRNQHRVDDSALLKRFPRLMFRIQKLESSLCSLHEVLLSGKTIATKSESRVRLNLIDSFITTVKTSKIIPSKGSLQTMLAQRQNLSTSESIKRCLESASRAVKRRRTKRHGPPARSRNQTVDTWLRSDLQYGADDDSGDDAFMDLEDFIADG